MLTVKKPGGREACSNADGHYWIDTLRNGRPVLIRHLAQKDREREYTFIRHLAPKSRYMRFLTQYREPGKGIAYIAMVHDNGQLVEIGVSRYVATGEHKFECMLAVADHWKHLGVGTLLMEHLIDAARKNNVHLMYSVAPSSNASVRDLARSLGFEAHEDPFDPHQVIHCLYL
ncbi:MAG: GNAT family N-acetyltransferase [Pseudomonas sp.]|uniref:GNAT family N-acetyltransferase n=1 Tax=Pseudomonas sp. TaxID=306 RepID=UPI003D6E84A5